jgi:hypothetical protein
MPCEGVPGQQVSLCIIPTLKRQHSAYHGGDGIRQALLARPVRLFYFRKPAFGSRGDRHHRQILAQQE